MIVLPIYTIYCTKSTIIYHLGKTIGKLKVSLPIISPPQYPHQVVKNTHFFDFLKNLVAYNGIILKSRKVIELKLLILVCGRVVLRQPIIKEDNDNL